MTLSEFCLGLGLGIWTRAWQLICAGFTRVMWVDRAAPWWSRSPHIRSHQGSSSCLRKKVRGSKNQIHLDPTLCILDSYDYNDPHSFDSFDGGEESLPFSLKVILFTLVMVALILIVFSASVGAICRIQCKVRDREGELSRIVYLSENKNTEHIRVLKL